MGWKVVGRVVVHTSVACGGMQQAVGQMAADDQRANEACVQVKAVKPVLGGAGNYVFAWGLPKTAG